MSAHEALVSFGFLVPAAQWWFIAGVTLVVFFILLALVLLWVAWQSLRAIPDQRDIGDDGLLGLVSSKAPSAEVPATETPTSALPPAAPTPLAPAASPATIRTASALSESAAEEIAAYWSEPSASIATPPDQQAVPVSPVEIQPIPDKDGPIVRPLAPLPKPVGLHNEAPLPASEAPTAPLASAPATAAPDHEHISPTLGLLVEDIRAQLAQPTAQLPSSSAKTTQLGQPTSPLPPPPPIPEPKTIPNPPRAGLTEQLPVQRKSLRPPAPKATPEATQCEAPPVTLSPAATTAAITALETQIVGRETTLPATGARPGFETSTAAMVVPPPPPPLPAQQAPVPLQQLQAKPSSASLPIAPPRFLADDRPTGIRREIAWLGVGLVFYAVVLGSLVVIFFPTARNWLLPPAWAERVAAIPRGLGLESPPPPPPVVKQVEVRQYANTYSSVLKGAGGKTVRTVTIAGLVKNITNETLYDLRAEIELYPRAPEAPPERRTIYLVPSRLEPQQEGRYTLTVTDAEYRQSSLKRIVTGDGKDMREVPAIFVQGTLAPPSEAETKATTARSTVLNR